MRNSTRIASGLALLAALAIGVLAYQFASVQAMHGVTKVLSDQLIALDDEGPAAGAASAMAAADARRRQSTAAAVAASGLVLVLAFAVYLSAARPLRRSVSDADEPAKERAEGQPDPNESTGLTELARDFNELAERLKEVEELKRDFVANVSHGLKGPLAAIHETIDILLEEIPGPLTAKQARLLDLSHKNADRLTSMISDLLEVSRMDQGSREYDPRLHDLTDIIESALRKVEPLAAERGLLLSFTAPEQDTTLLCDGDRVRGVVTNLARNAVAFSPDSGRVTLRVALTDKAPATVPAEWSKRPDPQTGPFLVLSIDDDGPGIPDADKDRIFEKFYQLNRGKRTQGQGAGLGLYIARSAVRAHGGAIWVEDREELGSTFRVLLPVTPVHWAEPPREVPRTTVRSKRADVPANHAS